MGKRNMPSRLRLAIIGCGRMGSFHQKAAFQLMEGAYEKYYKDSIGKYLKRLVLDSLVDPAFPNMGKDACGIHCFRSHEEMLRERKIDAAIIAAPIQAHYTIAKDFLSRGIPLLIEKHVATTTKEIRELKSLAEVSGVFLMPGHVERYNPVTHDILEILQFKIYGKIHSYKFTRTSRRPSRIPDSIIVDKLVHDIDLLLLFFGRPKTKEARFQHDRKGTVVEANLVFEHNNGVTGGVFSSWKVPKKERSVIIRAERGEISADFRKKNLFINRFHGFSKSVNGYNNNQVKDLMVDFIAGIYELVPPNVTIDDAIRCGTLIDRINRLAQKSRLA